MARPWLAGLISREVSAHTYRVLTATRVMRLRVSCRAVFVMASSLPYGLHIASPHHWRTPRPTYGRLCCRWASQFCVYCAASAL
jgi:hypothetical protein